MRCKLTIFSLVICESFRNPLSQIREKRNGSNEDKSDPLEYTYAFFPTEVSQFTVMITAKCQDDKRMDVWLILARLSLFLSMNQPSRGRGRAHALFFTSSTYASTRVNECCLPFVFIEKLITDSLSTFQRETSIPTSWEVIIIIVYTD